MQRYFPVTSVGGTCFLFPQHIPRDHNKSMCVSVLRRAGVSVMRLEGSGSSAGRRRGGYSGGPSEAAR
ncbi:hypothetical protein E2C01_096947 [Portunus trituberculatus]|uniref:Uncharacterized protein n=1 Tax=Portunus trituberculatus TaxID=210409 RepID=A0A5B7K331_PORTR|nr:hypothetical protein [Portunus trituberculatus]